MVVQRSAATTQGPFDTGLSSLFVAYLSSAELACFLELGWPLPAKILDLYVEFRAKTNIGGKRPLGFNSLLGALAYHGGAMLAADQKQSMRARIQAGEPFTADEQRDILDYCASDVDGLIQLLPHLAPAVHWPQALLRGRYTAAVAKMERTGVPVDVPLWRSLVAGWDRLKEHLISSVDRQYQIYEGTSFRTARFVDYLWRKCIPWPLYPDGVPILESRTFRDQALSYPQIAPLHQLRQTTAKMRLTGLTIGSDGRNRRMLSPFASSSGRNQPSNSKFIFGPAT